MAKKQKAKPVSNEYNFLVPLLLKSFQLKKEVISDADRRAIILAKYNLSKHTLIRLIMDYTNDPESNRWQFDSNGSYRTHRYTVTDNKTKMEFIVSNYNNVNSDDPNEVYNTKYIKVYTQNIKDYSATRDDLLNDIERLYLYLLFNGINTIEKNYRKLLNEQQRVRDYDHIKGLY